MTLGELLGRLPADRDLIVAPSGTWSRSRLLAGREKLSERLTGARVALQLSDTAELLRTLAALDGIAEAVGLFSISNEAAQVVQLATLGKFDAVICDNPASVEAVPGAPAAFRELESFVRPRSQALPPLETCWILSTSGTTGQPKLVSHSLRSLTVTTKDDSTRGASVTWGMLYDHARFAGLQVVLQSAVSGARLIAPDAQLTLRQKIETFASHGCTHLSATPTMWRKIVMTPGAELLHLKQATLGGEIADDSVLSALAGLFSKARISHVFASTEAGVGFSVADRRAGFPESYLLSPPAGISLRVDNGRLYIRNSRVLPSYVGTDVRFSSLDGWIDTGDSVVTANGRVNFIGRSDGVINVGGDKVHPEEVERVLLAHPAVAAAHVYAKSSPITGSLIAANIVLHDPSKATRELRDDIRHFTQDKLLKHQVPHFIVFVPEIELNSAGKMSRR